MHFIYKKHIIKLSEGIMVNNNKMDGIDVLCKFYQLSEEEQKKVLKRLISTI